jgi:hypothetical protein
MTHHCGFIKNANASQRFKPATCEGCPGMMCPRPLYLARSTETTVFQPVQSNCAAQLPGSNAGMQTSLTT